MFNKDKAYINILTEILTQVRRERKLAAKEEDLTKSLFHDHIAMGLMNASDIVSKAFKELYNEETDN